jgi:hypothetical protein
MALYSSSSTPRPKEKEIEVITLLNNTPKKLGKVIHIPRRSSRTLAKLAR